MAKPVGPSGPGFVSGRLTSETAASDWKHLLDMSFYKRLGVNTLVAIVFSFWAGAVNTVATLSILFERASHVSGRVNDIGMNLVLDPIDALLVFLIWVGFCFGGYLAGKMVDRIGYTKSLIMVALGIAIGGLLVRAGGYAVDGDDYGVGRMLFAFYMPITMGIQNGITTLTPHIGRTTHWTGDSTDLGLAFARGDSPYAIHNVLKIFGFIAGAAVFGYIVGMIEIPGENSIYMIAIGFLVTTIIFHLMNQYRAKSAKS